MGRESLNEPNSLWNVLLVIRMFLESLCHVQIAVLECKMDGHLFQSVSCGA